MKRILLPCFKIAISALAGLLLLTTSPSALAEPTIQAEPTYCDATPVKPYKTKNSNKDAVQAAVSLNCSGPQLLEFNYEITDGVHVWTGSVVQNTPPPGSTTPPYGATINTLKHVIGGTWTNRKTYTLTGQVKIWPVTGLQNPPNIFPTGTPLRTIQLPAVSSVM